MPHLKEISNQATHFCHLFVLSFKNIFNTQTIRASLKTLQALIELEGTLLSFMKSILCPRNQFKLL